MLSSAASASTKLARARAESARKTLMVANN